MQKRLWLERKIRAWWASALTIDAVLEALDRPAFIVGPRAAIEAANTRGIALLESDPEPLRQSIRDCQRQPEGAGDFSLTPLRLTGLAPHWLAIRRSREPSMADRLAIALERWKADASADPRPGALGDRRGEQGDRGKLGVRHGHGRKPCHRALSALGRAIARGARLSPSVDRIGGPYGRNLWTSAPARGIEPV